jgi:peptide/nickel transport system ATP-binding protein
MYLGRLVEERSRAGLFAGPSHPYTRALLDSVLTPDSDLGLPAMAIGAVFPNPLSDGRGCPFTPRCPSAMDICRTIAPAVHALQDGWATCHLLQQETVSQ